MKKAKAMPGRVEPVVICEICEAVCFSPDKHATLIKRAKKLDKYLEIRSAVDRFYQANQKANQNARLLVSSAMTSKEANKIMKELENAKDALFALIR